MTTQLKMVLGEILIENSTVEHGHKIIKKKSSENNIIALKQQLLGLILCLFMHLK